MLLEETVDLGEHGSLGFAGDGASIDFDAATFRHDVGLTASLDDSDVGGRRPEERMRSLLELFNVLSEQEVGYLGHGMDGALAKVGRGPVGGLATSLEA